jgi:hypothetical protein
MGYENPFEYDDMGTRSPGGQLVYFYSEKYGQEFPWIKKNLPPRVMLD